MTYVLAFDPGSLGPDPRSETGVAVFGEDGLIFSTQAPMEEACGIACQQVMRQFCAPDLLVVEHLLDQVEVAARRERLALAGDDHRPDVGVGVDVAPDVGELPVGLRVDRVVALGLVECQPKEPILGLFDQELVVGGVAIAVGGGQFG